MDSCCAHRAGGIYVEIAFLETDREHEVNGLRSQGKDLKWQLLKNEKYEVCGASGDGFLLQAFIAYMKTLMDHEL